MGYYFSVLDSNFTIDNSQITNLISAIKELGDPEKESGVVSDCNDSSKNEDFMGGSHYQDGLKVSSHYSWVNMNFVNLNDIKEIFNCWRWHIDFDDDGNICEISFNGEKLGDEEFFFKKIAPFVKDNSYIECLGEDNYMWRWKFVNGVCTEISPKIIWE